ncbi:hypothetical protein [Psychroserpens sp. S379A]|uniref:hypothetical protein n=1 Tax=Psychroserpens sp. S379A TaxID=3415137 RepID=UPI003C7DD63D
MEKLEKYFKGEKYWIEYSINFGDSWNESEFQKELLSQLDNKIDLAKVIYYHCAESSIKWINSKIPALDNIKPVECIKNDELIKRLKVCLMRFPC